VCSIVALKWNTEPVSQCEHSWRRINLPLWLVWEWRSHTCFFNNTFPPTSNNFWTNVQLSTKSDASYWPIFCCL